MENIFLRNQKPKPEAILRVARKTDAHAKHGTKENALKAKNATTGMYQIANSGTATVQRTSVWQKIAFIVILIRPMQE